MTEAPLSPEKLLESHRHDAHLLDLLSGVPSWEVTKYTPSTSHKEPSPDIRFDVASSDKKKWMTVGVSRLTTTLPFTFGKPVINFFCFYHFAPKADEWFRDYLYNSELYIWTAAGLKPYKDTWWGRLVKLTNDWSKRIWADVGYYAKTGENPEAIEKALINATLHVAQPHAEDFQKILGMRLL